ncbi:HAMP domain-containing sensor histidine kinase [Rheinheimera sp. MMS21-TC3]|uniref:sensor histidine kinase n=1 Tax=Rheinheimera sp. MMS21-TC3 TaxID=3072790 RepID=UPI0028C4E236|nr:HAMP domain-containing sensor histidine kinase [Rheinheimera sp. MMS21-TC3]WNO60554.1 HAMP domain-containing sensor histidine kinase [Rheinheimera sp. MMS21-TC3]
MQLKSLSRKLLTQVLSVYFILTFIVSLGQIFSEYFLAKSYINEELNSLQQTLTTSLSQAIWELNTDQVLAISQKMSAIPIIEGIIIRDEHAKLLNPVSEQLLAKISIPDYSSRYEIPLANNNSGLFGATFPLIVKYSGRSTQVGDLTLISSRTIAVQRVKDSIYVIVANAFIKTTFLITLFLLAFRKHLTLPLTQLTEQIEAIELEQLAESKISLTKQSSVELSIMANTFTRLIHRVQDYQQQLKTAQQQLLTANNKLDQQNLKLEQDVARKTSGLSQAMIDLQHQKQQLEIKQQSLVTEVDRRKETEQALLIKQDELESTVADLKQAHERLIQSEKMAALGGLVAGITHEVNTPVGIGVTATSFLTEKINQLNHDFTAKTLTSSQLESFIEAASQSAELIQSNLERAAELIASFKQIAVDQASNAIRTINLAQYINEITHSLKPNLKKTNHQIEVNCPDNIVLDCPAGAISQIITNLMMNSLLHAFDNMAEGLIRISIQEIENNIDLKYSDNGKGLNSEQLAQLFNPFFTTTRNLGGSGLGAHIIYNLVRQTLHGSIQVTSELGQGLHYHIRFPKNPLAIT